MTPRTVRFPPALWKLLDELAERTGTTPSAMLREAASEAIARDMARGMLRPYAPITNRGDFRQGGRL